jgi:hypothetical protein
MQSLGSDWQFRRMNIATSVDQQISTGRSALLDRGSGRAGVNAVDSELLLAAALLSAATVVGLATAADYGLTVDEFNADDYGPKALAWYTSGFNDRAHFETVEFSLWYYGPWFHMLTAFVQSFDIADRFTVRHAMTFLVGLLGLAALLPIGRLAVGRWAGLTAVTLCLLTGYVYGSLFFTPIDVPFLAAMTWSTLAILVMTRQVLPSWSATIATGMLTGLAIGTRTGGIITHAYLLLGMLLCAAEFIATRSGPAMSYLAKIGVRYVAVVVIAWLVAIALWPWLHVGNPFQQFKTALLHFSNIPMSFDFLHWGERVWTDDLPRSYIPEQLLARLPEGFLALLAVAVVHAIAVAAIVTRDIGSIWRISRRAALRGAALALARRRGIFVVCAAVILPLGFLISQRVAIYDGVRHALFVIPMLAILAGAGMTALLPLLRQAPLIATASGAAYAGSLVLYLAVLHPFEYVAMNALAGGTRDGYDLFETDYWSAAATTALRRLEQRLDYDPSVLPAETPPSILICIPWREAAVGPLLRRPWSVETDPQKAELIIETQRWRCAENLSSVVLIDEVKRFGRSFAWVYAKRSPHEPQRNAGQLR